MHAVAPLKITNRKRRSFIRRSTERTFMMTTTTKAQLTAEKQAALTAEQAPELLDYDPASGLLRWKVRRGSMGVGSVAGNKGADGYVRVRVAGRDYLAHRLCWLIFHGRWPAHLLDHVDGRRDHNAIRNLREATVLDSQRNRRYRNSTGYRGVRQHGRRFVASITIEGRWTYLGTYRLPEVAHEVYLQVARQHFGQFANRLDEDA
jgi:hypothetical protein